MRRTTRVQESTYERETDGGEGDGRGEKQEETRRCYRDEESSYSRFKCIDDVLMAHQVGVMRVALGITSQPPLIVVSRGYLCVVGINRRARATGGDGSEERERGASIIND